MKRNKLLASAGPRQKAGLVKKIAVMLVTLAMVGSISCGCSSSAPGDGSGQANGQVHLEFPNGGEYQGNLRNGQRSGQGTFTCPDPNHLFQTVTITYTGDLTKDGRLSGSGTIRYPNGDTYTGTVSSGKKTGGTYTFRNGDRYVGTFSGDRMCDGTYTFSTGQTLKGHFDRGLPSGKMIYTDHGISYNTTWSNGTCVGITFA